MNRGRWRCWGWRFRFSWVCWPQRWYFCRACGQCPPRVDRETVGGLGWIGGNCRSLVGLCVDGLVPCDLRGKSGLRECGSGVCWPRIALRNREIRATGTTGPIDSGVPARKIQIFSQVKGNAGSISGRTLRFSAGVLGITTETAAGCWLSGEDQDSWQVQTFHQETRPCEPLAGICGAGSC